MKGTFRIGGALLLGTLIILGAFWVRGRGGASEPGSIIVAPAPERTAIVTRDSDGDGVEDWEENLVGRAFETISISTSTALFGEEDTGPYEKPTTLTGRFSEAFLQDYLEGKMRGADFSDPTALVGSAVSAIESSAKARRYTRLDVIQVPSSPESVRMYGNDVAGSVQRHSVKNENEALILQRALEANEPELLKELAPIRTVYEKVLSDLLVVPVPTPLVEEHLQLLTATEAIRTDIEAMEVAFTDPLYALARIRGYQNDAQALYDALQTIAKTLSQYGVNYENDEPGAAFYLFET